MLSVLVQKTTKRIAIIGLILGLSLLPIVASPAFAGCISASGGTCTG